MEHTENSRIAGLSYEAARWFVRLKDGDLTTAERHEYLGWLKQAPANVAEMLRIAGVYTAVRGARLKGHISLEDAAPNVVAWQGPATVAAAPLSGRRHRAAWKIAATLAALAIAGVLALPMLFGRTIESGAGEWRHVALEDGSFLRLGPNTRLRVKLDETRRSIGLERGEATFQVARDANRPFVVSAGLADVRAVGTMFGVERGKGQVVVTVAEGAVAISDTADPVPVSAGEQAIVSPTGPTRVRKVDVIRELAWAEGRLMFESETLAEALAEFNRRNRLQIRLEDAALATLPVRGVFDAADPQSFVDFLVTAADIEAKPVAGRYLLLKRKRGDGFTR